MGADNVRAVTDVDEDDGMDSYGPELIDETCPDCGEKLLRSYTGVKWCSKYWDQDKKECKMKHHIKIDC